MFVHLLQAIVIAVLFMFPFVYDINDFTTSHRRANICATVDSAIVKHYSQTGSLPQKLDAETLKKFGLDEKAAEGMTYEKLEDRKFVLHYEDAKDNVNESIHSRTLLPVNVNTNFGEVEDKTKYYWLEVPESANQTVIVVVTLPDGSKIELQEGERKEFPVSSEFEVKVEADKGFSPGKGLPENGILNKDMILEVTEAEWNLVKITFNKNFVMPKEGELSIWKSCYAFAELVTPEATFNVQIDNKDFCNVPKGTYIYEHSPVITSQKVYKIDYTPINFNAEEDTVIDVTYKRTGFLVNVAETSNQTVRVYINPNTNLSWKNLYRPDDISSNPYSFCIQNGESCLVPDPSISVIKAIPRIVKVEVIADKGYKPGTPSVTSCDITGDMTVTATPAVSISGGGSEADIPYGEYIADSDYGDFKFTVPKGVDRIMSIYAVGWGWLISNADNHYNWHMGDNAPLLPEDTRYRYCIIGVTPGKTYNMHVFQEDYTPYPPKLRWSKEINQMPIDWSDL